MNGYRIPFEGANDVDEGLNSENEYSLKCFEENCFTMFELLIVSRSSSIFQYDQLALKYLPMKTSNENQFQLKISTRNRIPLKNKEENEENVLMIKVEIEEKEKEKEFSELNYEFVVLLNSSLTTEKEESKIRIGRVNVINVKSIERIFYQIISSKKKNEIEINSLTGELFYYFNGILSEEEMKIEVQASILKQNSSKIFYKKCEVKFKFRETNFVEQIFFSFSFRKEENEIIRLNNSNQFLIDENIRVNETILEISIQSFKYQSDEFILSLNNFLNSFSISKKKKNIYSLKIKQKLHSKSIFLLNISLKHQLTQHFLPNLLLVELIVVNQLTTPQTTTTTMSESIEFCQMNEEFQLFSIDEKKKKRIGLMKVIKSNLTTKRRNENLIGEINEKEKIKIDQCEMFFDQTKKLNLSSNYSLCQISFPHFCFYSNFIQNLTNQNQQKLLLTIEQIHFIFFIFSLTFIFISFLLILFIFQLKNVHPCSTLFNKCRLFIHRLDQSNQQFSSSFSSPSSSVKVQVRFSSFSPNSLI